MPRSKKIKVKQASEISRQRRHQRNSTIKVVNRVTPAQFEDMHRFCINPSDIREMVERLTRRAHKKGKEVYLPSKLLAVCDYPNQGYCFHGQPSPEILKKINDKLGFKDTWQEPEKPTKKVKEKAIPIKEAIKEKPIVEIPVKVVDTGKFKIKIGGIK